MTELSWLAGGESCESLFVGSPRTAFVAKSFIHHALAQNWVLVRLPSVSGCCGLYRLDVTRNVTRLERLGSSLVRNSRLRILSLCAAETYDVYADESIGTA